MAIQFFACLIYAFKPMGEYIGGHAVMREKLKQSYAVDDFLSKAVDLQPKDSEQPSLP
jgi:hypothetical protein